MSRGLEIVARRLRQQRLTGPGLARASDVVRELCAVQAQDYSGATWAVAQRTRGVTHADVEAEFTNGSMLRTHVLRPTWHFVAPEDLRWMLALTGSRISRIMGHYDRELGLPPAVYRRSTEVFARALQGGKYLTRTELAAELERAGVRITSGQALARVVMRAETDAVVTSGPPRGKQFTYALLDERVKPAAVRERDDVLGELVRRYFATRGPATAHDCAWWSGLTLADVKRGLEIVGRDLDQSTQNGRTWWFVDSGAPRRRHSAHLLPNYDEFFIGYKDRSAIGERIGHIKNVTGGNSLIAHVVCVDGQLVGGWKQAVDKERVVVSLNLAVKVSAAERKRVAAAVKRLGRFHGLSPVLLPAHLRA